MSDFELPVTRYALSGDINIAHQTMGDGPVDIILVPGFVNNATSITCKVLALSSASS
jgi:hypothetical protein